LNEAAATEMISWMSRPLIRSPAARTDPQDREQYYIERELASRLRAAQSREERRLLYGQVYREFNERVRHYTLAIQAEDPIVQAAAVAPQVRLLRGFVGPHSVFCELGAGDGAVARALAPIVSSSVALDVTDALLRGPNPDANFRFRVFDGLDPNLPPASVDLAYSRDLVEHLQPDDMLEQTAAVARSLKPGGIYVCVTPNALSGPHDVSRIFDDAPRGLHLKEYTSTELAQAFRKAGFSQVRVLISARGWRLAPLLSMWPVTRVEAVLMRLPRWVKRRIARLLAAVKVAGIR
jgi:SAM-dependent methyltransferase